MPHPWEQLVLGGVGQPRILSIKDNLCSNPFFTKNLDGWSLIVGVGGDELLDRVESDTAYGQYTGQITYTSNLGYVEYTYDFGSSIEDKVFFLSVDIISELEDFSLSFYGTNEFGLKHFGDSSNLRKCFIIATATGQTSETLTIRIYGTRSEPADPRNANLLFDNVYFAEVYEDIVFPQPHDSGKLIFEKIKIGENTLITQQNKEFRVRWKPNFMCSYFHISKEFEEYRELIARTEMLFCIPHNDLDWGFIGRWLPTEFIRSYPFNEYTGHKGIISIEGNEYMIKKPSWKVGE